MYEHHFGFTTRPFLLVPDPVFLYPSRQHAMAETILEYGLESQASFCLLTGEIGSGKSLLVSRLLRKLGDGVVVGLINQTHNRFQSIHGWAASALNVQPRDDSEVAMHEALIDALVREYAKGRRTLLIIDEAQNLSIELLEELRLLSNVNSEKDLLLQILLVGQPELRRKLSRPELEQFAQRVSVHFHLTALENSETHAYVQHRLRVAGGDPYLFLPEAIDVVHARTRGVPRLINQLCDFALTHAYAEGRTRVDADLMALTLRDPRTGFGLPPVSIVDLLAAAATPPRVRPVPAPVVAAPPAPAPAAPPPPPPQPVPPLQAEPLESYNLIDASDDASTRALPDAFDAENLSLQAEAPVQTHDREAWLHDREAFATAGRAFGRRRRQRYAVAVAVPVVLAVAVAGALWWQRQTRPVLTADIIAAPTPVAPVVPPMGPSAVPVTASPVTPSVATAAQPSAEAPSKGPHLSARTETTPSRSELPAAPAPSLPAARAATENATANLGTSTQVSNAQPLRSEADRVTQPAVAAVAATTVPPSAAEATATTATPVVTPPLSPTADPAVSAASSPTESSTPAKSDEPKYFAARATSPLNVEYPRNAEGAIEGSVTLEFTIGSDGRASDVAIIDAKPRGMFDRAAVDAVRHGHFDTRALADHPAERARLKLTFKRS